MVPVCGNGVFPCLEDGIGADQGKETGGIFDMTGKLMDSLFFMRQEAGTNTVLCEVPVVVLVFKPKEGDFGSCGTAGQQEDAETEQGEEKL